MSTEKNRGRRYLADIFGRQTHWCWSWMWLSWRLGVVVSRSTDRRRGRAVLMLGPLSIEAYRLVTPPGERTT